MNDVRDEIVSLVMGFGAALVLTAAGFYCAFVVGMSHHAHPSWPSWHDSLARFALWPAGWLGRVTDSLAIGLGVTVLVWTLGFGLLIRLLLAAGRRRRKRK